MSPYLNFAQVQVLDTNGVVLASGTNSASGVGVLLSSVAITNDGTYRVYVQASSAAPTNTGYYLVTVWPTTPNVYALTMNQIVSGSIQTPYSVDQWTFGVSSNQQVDFHLVNISGAGIGFDLRGPNGWLGFTNLTTDSGYLTLPYAGSYSVSAHSLSGEYGAIYAFEMMLTAQTNLTLGTQYQGQWTASGQAQLFQFNVSASAPLQVLLNNLAANNHCDVYARFGQPPTRSTYDYSATAASGPNQQLLIPVATAGTWYVLVYADNIQTPANYTITASSYSVMLFSVTPSICGSNSPATLTLAGAGFDSSCTVQFVDGSNDLYTATSATVDSFTQITVTEAASTLPPGTYSVSVSPALGNPATLSNAFQVASVALANFSSDLIVPGQIGYHVPSTIYAEYNNSGGAAMPAPLLVLTATQNGNPGALLTMDSTLVTVGLWTSAQPAGFSHTQQFLGFGQTPGVLQPGEYYRVPIYYAGWQEPWDRTYPPVNWNLGVVHAWDPTPVDWTSLEASMRPANIATDAWAAIWTAFTAEVGSTWGDYVIMLDYNASYLGRLGVNVSDISKLLAFQFMQADGLTPLRSLASSVDASVTTPGLPLTFSRSFGEPISQRYALGPLGRGWSHNWQYSLQQASDGTVTIFGPGGSQRVFQPNTLNGGYFAQAGDYGVLAAGGGGTYTLTEKSGLLYFYQSNGMLGYVQDLNQNRITLGYSGNLLTSLTHSSGQNIQIAYNGAGTIQTITDNYGHQTVLSYDGSGQHLVGAQYYDGRTATYTYNTTGAITQLHALTGVASSCCNWRYFNYDSLGRLVGTYLAGNAEALTLSYGTGGQVTVTDALGNPTQFFYDNRGLLTKTQDALGNAVHLTFDDSYNLVSVMDPAGRSYSYTYDGEGNVTQSMDPLANTSRFTYQPAFNRLASVTDARNNATRYSYDPSGNLQTITYADSSTESWSYYAVGNPETWNNRRGHQTFYTYNNNGQVTGKYFADGSETLYAYDSQGDLTNAATFGSILNPLESSTMIYDGSNRLSQITYPSGKYLVFTYDSTGRRTSSTDQLGHSLYYSYDAAGRLSSMTNELNALVVQYQYDPTGRIATKTLGSGLFNTYQYDPAGQLLSLTNALANGTVLSSFNYTYDGRGRRTTMTTLDGNWTYAYDDIGQLTNAVYVAVTTNVPNQNLTYVYDALGNRTSTIENGVTINYTANNLNQYVSAGTTNYTFDADGNLISEVSPQGTTTYTYNDENRLVSVTSPQGNWQYTYDGLGNRTVVTANGTATRDVIDPIGLGNVVGEYDSSGNLIAHYDHSLGLLSRIDPTGNVAGYTFDGTGNAQQIVSPAGAVLNSYAYKPFGGVPHNVATIPNPFQFNGQFGVMADNNGLNFMRNRFYSPVIGRFESQDPSGLAGDDINLYRYAQNTPVFLVDPAGTFSVSIPNSVWSTLANNYWKVGFNHWISRQTWLYTIGDTGRYFLNRFNLAPYVVNFGYVSRLGWILDLPWLTVFNPIEWWNFGTEHQAEVNQTIYISWLNFFLSQNQWPTPPTQLGGSGNSHASGAEDPNQMTGPAGYGPSGFLSLSNSFSYRIDFENATNATAPVQQVVITDQLSTNFDWTTFSVTEVGFGNTLIPISPGTQHYEANVPASYLGTNFQVQIQIGIQPTNGQVYANFQSIDPTTSLPPPVNVGFLPPEDGTGRGQGHVTYTIRAKSGLATGVQLRNVSLISFDNQPTIATDQVDDNNPAAGTDSNKECLITIDSVAPTSHVLPLPAQTQTLRFSVSWTGQGDPGGSGIANYDIYVSDNGGPWTIWQSATTSTTATFTGQHLHTYGFYSIARDNAGNVEAPHLAADATTTVVANPLLEVTLTPASSNVFLNESFSYTIFVKNIGSLALNNVVLSNTIPAGLAADWVMYGRGSCDIGDTWIVWSLGNLSTNVSATMNVTTTAATIGDWTNFVTIADRDGATSTSAVEQIQITLPTLTIALTNHQVVLAWPQAASTYSLETTTNLTLQTSWTSVTNVPAVASGQNTVTLPIIAPSQFFHLHSQ